jgi:Tfp pilus assembly protein PilF
MGKSSGKKRKAPDYTATDHNTSESLCIPDDKQLSEEKFTPKIKNLKYFLAASVAVTTFLVYLSSLQNEFVNWDDHVYVFENPNIRLLNLNFFKWAFLDFHNGNWHPLTWISHALDYALWGLNPLGHHLTNNVLHAANTFLVVLLVVRLLASWQADKLTSPPDAYFALIAAATTGLLFGLHPLHVESVAWVSERKDLLCAMFFLLSIMMYAEHVSGTKPVSRFLNRHYLFALVFFMLALLSKPMAITLPAVLLILDWFPFKRIQSLKSFQSAIIEKVPFIALSLFSSILTFLAQRAEGAMGTIPPPLSARVLVTAESLIAYLYKMAVPLNLVPFYPYPTDISFLSVKYGLPVVLVIGISVMCITIVKKERLWLAAWCYYVITLFPVLGIIVQVGIQLRADRYTYLPSLGPFLITGLCAAWASTKVFTVKKLGIVSKLFTAAVALIALVFMSYLTFRQITIWKNGISLWSYVIEKEPQKVPSAYINRGVMFSQMGHPDRAIADFDKAIELNPSQLGVFLNPAYKEEAYMKRGSVYENMGQIKKAIADFDKTIELNPLYYDAYIRKGVLYGMAGSFDKAVEQFNKVIEIDQDNSTAYNNRGYAYYLIGWNSRALEDFNKAIDLDQNNTNAYINRGNLHHKTGSREMAGSDFQKACDLGALAGCSALQTLRIQ